MVKDELAAIKRQQGLTLVELLVGIFLQSLVLLILAQLYLSGGSSLRMQQETGKVQSRGQYATSLLAGDLRSAGYFGCRNLDDPKHSVEVVAQGVSKFDSIDDAVEIIDGGSSWSAPTGFTHLSGTDVLRVAYASGGAYLASEVVPTTGNIQVAGMVGLFSEGDLVLVSDCQNTHIFRATGVESSESAATISYTGAQNIGGLSNYAENSQVFKFQDVTWFVATSGNEQGLYRQVGGGAPVLVASSVEAFRVVLVEHSLSAGIRYGLALATDRQVADTAVPFEFDGDDLNESDGDRKVRRVFSGYYNLRNFGS